MSDEDDSPPDPEPSPSVGESLEKRRRELDQRERGLDDLADELDEREAALDEREQELEDREATLDDRAEGLDEREARIRERESELDDRETAIEERERDLAARAEELDEQEATIRKYVDDSVRGTVEEAVSKSLAGRDGSSRLGTIGSLVLALVGVTLIIGGVLNGFATEIAAVPLVFSSDTANLGVTVLLLFSGLAANLAAVAD